MKRYSPHNDPKKYHFVCRSEDDRIYYTSHLFFLNLFRMLLDICMHSIFSLFVYNNAIYMYMYIIMHIIIKYHVEEVISVSNFSTLIN